MEAPSEPPNVYEVRAVCRNVIELEPRTPLDRVSKGAAVDAAPPAAAAFATAPVVWFSVLPLTRASNTQRLPNWFVYPRVSY